MTTQSQHHVHAKIALCLILMLTVVLGTTPHALAADSDTLIMDDIVGGTNPFPDKISDEQVQNKVEAFSSKHNGYRAGSYIYSYMAELVLDDGSTVTIYSNLTDPEILPYDWLQKYFGHIKQVKFFMVIPANDDASNKITTTFINTFRLNSNTLSNDAASLINKNAPLTELKINGKTYDPGYSYFQWKEGVRSTTYFEGTFEFPTEPVLWARLFGYPSMSSSGSYPSTSMLVTNTYYIPRAHFHYVNDAAYRTSLNTDKNAPIAQRSNGAGWSSTAPATKLDIADLQDELTLSDTFHGRYFFSKNPNSNIFPYFSRADVTYNNKVFGDAGRPEATTARPTYEQAIQAGPLGFAYVADDIDKPQDPSDPKSFDLTTEAAKGNYYFTPVLFPDGTLSLDKHYYILYRQMPTPVTILKTDPAAKPVPNVVMDLYRVDPDTQEESLVAGNLTTDADGKIFATTTTTVDQAALTTLTTSDAYDESVGYVTSDGTTYLAPGTYKLKETSVPRGYAKAEKTFMVDPIQSQIASKDDPVNVQQVTFQNELAPTFPVVYVFTSADGSELPEDVLQLTPQDSATYYEGDPVEILDPKQTNVTTPDGTWTFDGYQEEPQLVMAEKNLTDGKLMIHGVWSFTPAPEPETPDTPNTPDTPVSPKPTPGDMVKPAGKNTKVTPATGDTFSAEALVLVGLGATVLLGSSQVLRKRS